LCRRIAGELVPPADGTVCSDEPSCPVSSPPERRRLADGERAFSKSLGLVYASDFEVRFRFFGELVARLHGGNQPI
jgi:hypothetical protein